MAPKVPGGFVWTEQENEWFMKITADFMRWRAMTDEDPGETHFYVERALAAWYDAFPERHPRTYRQHAVSSEEASLVLPTNEMLRMHEVRTLNLWRSHTYPDQRPLEARATQAQLQQEDNRRNGAGMKGSIVRLSD